MAERPRPIDWLRVGHRAFTLLRSLRGDDQLDTDHKIERTRAKTLTQSMDQIGRQAMGCAAPEPCDCRLCQENNDNASE